MEVNKKHSIVHSFNRYSTICVAVYEKPPRISRVRLVLTSMSECNYSDLVVKCKYVEYKFILYVHYNMHFLFGFSTPPFRITFTYNIEIGVAECSFLHFKLSKFSPIAGMPHAFSKLGGGISNGGDKICNTSPMCFIESKIFTRFL